MAHAVGGTVRPEGQARGFGSDNQAGIHPEVLTAIIAANGGHQVAYGADAYTAHLGQVIRDHFGERAQVYPVLTGTGANVIGLQAMSERWGAVICAQGSHIDVDECAATERVAGLKLLPVPTPDGKLTTELVATRVWGVGEPHHAQPQIVSLTQSTEVGTLYTTGEITAVCAYAHENGMRVHMDGARLANAAAALDLPLRAFTTDAGVDVLSFGGTKNGLLLGEAIVVLNPDAIRGIDYLRKGAMQLVSKMRFVSAQLIALLEGDLWLRNARHANAMARRLAEAVAMVPGVSVTRPVHANAVFVILPTDVAERLRKRFHFYTWDEKTGEVRLMAAFDTTEDDVDAFAAALAEEMAGS